jgi:hypothetical protein
VHRTEEKGEIVLKEVDREAGVNREGPKKGRIWPSYGRGRGRRRRDRRRGRKQRGR